MKAGFARLDITPPVGTFLMGWGSPVQRPATRVNDPLFVRALWLEDGHEVAVVITFDFCFVPREASERWHGILMRDHGLLPRQVLFAATHTHAGPAVGTYLDMMDHKPDRNYQAQVDAAVLRVIDLAKQAAVDATMSTGSTRSALPVNRRRQKPEGIANAPNLSGAVFDQVPLAMFANGAGEPICLLFSVATHPVCFTKPEISADYPGAAMQLLDEHFGRTCSLFVQGPAGDSRPRNLVNGEKWKSGTGFAETQEAGAMLANEVIAALKNLRPASVELKSALIESHWPVQVMDDVAMRRIADGSDKGRSAWARRQLQLRSCHAARNDAPILMHLLQLGTDTRLLGIEGEPLQEYGQLTTRAFSQGTTFCAGYCHGEGMYLVTTPMLTQGGYEPESYWEYHQPGPLAPGMENVFIDTLKQLRSQLDAT